MSTLSKLEPFKDVLSRQEPKVPGEPIDMNCFTNGLPKKCGDPWIGAYSKHGFWFKLQEVTKEDFDKLVVWSIEQDKYMLNYDYYETWKRCYPGGVRFIVAKNLKHDILGGVVSLDKGAHLQVGCYFVQEDYRHSGIGSTMFKEITKNVDKTIVFNSMHHLHGKLSRFGLRLYFGREFLHYKLDKPTGFPDLENVPSDILICTKTELDDDDWHKLGSFDSRVSGKTRPVREMMDIEDSSFAACFNQTGCVGYGMSREVAGGEIRRIVVGPIYASQARVAEAILRDILKRYYNPEDDFDFDVDVNAIYRRDVHFIVPKENREMAALMRKLAGKAAVDQQRLRYQTASSGQLPGISSSMVYATGDLHSVII